MSCFNPAILYSYYKADTISTYTQGLLMANGPQKRILTIISDTTTSNNGTWLYDGIAGVLTKISGVSGASGNGVQFAATKAAATGLARVSGSFIRVATDEENNGDKSLYLDNGTTLEFQYTII